MAPLPSLPYLPSPSAPLAPAPQRQALSGLIPRGSFWTACTRRLKIHTLLVGEGTCLVWHIYALESRL